jgi:hypothetical protein
VGDDYKYSVFCRISAIFAVAQAIDEVADAIKALKKP